MKTTIETITPEKATAYLKRNKINRPIRIAVVEGYALDMRKGHWALTHQGIALDEHDNVIDGQHRLEAIRLANIPIKMMVTRGIPEIASQNGLEVFSMDTVDRGKLRSVGDQLVLRHGCKNGNTTAGAIQQIALICLSGEYVKLTVPTAVAILNIYKSELEYCLANHSMEVGLRSVITIGCCAFAMKSDREKVKEFYDLLVTGEGLHKTGPTSPILVLRKHLQSNPHMSGANGRWQKACAVLNSIKHYVNGEEASFMKHTKLGVEFVVNRQKSAVAKVCELLAV